MKFSNPAFLFALFSLAIPVIIHLFNFRKFKRVYFTNVRFLKDVKQETSSRNRLKHLLVLACRLLAITFLVLAFARPYLPVENTKIKTGTKAVSIYVDNSFSMQAENKSGKLFDQAIKNAKDIASSYKSTDLFNLVTNDFEGKHQRLVNKEEFLELLHDVKTGSAVKTSSEVITRQKDILKSANVPTGNYRSFLISDFQKSSTDPFLVKRDTTVEFYLVPVVAQQRSNVYIDSCWFVSPVRRLNSAENLNIRIVNDSENDLTDVPLRLFINGQPKTPASFNLPANSSVDTVITFTSREPGIQQGVIEITDSPIVFDDKFYFSYSISKTIPVLSITGKNEGLQTEASSESGISKLFGGDSLFQFKEVTETNVDLNELKTRRFIILNGLNSISTGLARDLKDFVSNGGSIAIFPGANLEFTSYKSFLTSLGTNHFLETDTSNQKTDKVNFEHEIYSGVFEKRDANIDLPSTFSHYKTSRAVRTGEENLLRLRNGDPLISFYPSGKGRVYLASVPLDDDFSNFTSHSLFVVTLYQAALFSQPTTRLYYTVGKDEIIELSNVNLKGEKVFHISSDADPKFDIIPETRSIGSKTEVFPRNQIPTSGSYKIVHNKEFLAGVAFNYDRKESKQEMYSPDELVKAFQDDRGLTNFSLVKTGAKDLTTLLSEIDEGKKLWKWCVLLALIFLLCEVLILRFWSRSVAVKTESKEK